MFLFQRWFATFLLVALPLFGATPPPALSPLVFEISFSKELSATPIDGHILLIISKNDKQEPRFGVGEGVESQQAFGVDVDGWQPGARGWDNPRLSPRFAERA